MDAVILPDGGRLFWPFFHEVLGRYSELRQWRVVQKGALHLKVQVVMAGEGTDLLARIAADLRRAVPQEMVVQVEDVETIPWVPEEKTRMVISRCNAAQEEDPGYRQ